MNHLHVSSIGTPWFYGVFFIVIVIMIGVDMVILKKEGVHKVSIKEALIWSVAWVAVSLGFAIWLYFYLSHHAEYGSVIAMDKTLAFLTGYVLEKSLSMDNIFVFVMIFSYFKVPLAYQHRVLLYGVLGVIILRGLMVWVGAVLVHEFEWILYLFGVFLVYGGIKMMRPTIDQHVDLGHNKMVTWLSKHIPMSMTFYGEKFFIWEQGKILATPLLMVLLIIELSDVLFAVDSIPAVFSVSTDPFIVLTSNIFAVLGLRAMYFLLANIIERMVYLKYGLAIILMFIGIKMLIVDWYSISTSMSLLFIFGVLMITMIFSLNKKSCAD